MSTTLTSRYNHLLREREQFLTLLTSDLTSYQIKIRNYEQLIQHNRDTINHLNELSMRVEHTALVPLTSKLYVNGTIRHTGEYYCGTPDSSYAVLKRRDDVIGTLETRQRALQATVHDLQVCSAQMQARIQILSGGTDDIIQSERGMALRYGDVYEIIEFDD